MSGENLKQGVLLFLVSTVVCVFAFGLPLNATGNLPRFVNSLAGLGFMTVFGCWLLVEAVFVNHRSMSTQQHWAVRLVFALMIYGGLVFTVLEFARHPYEKHIVLMWVGIFLSSLGVLLRYWAIRSLGNFFTYELQVHSGQRLVQEGPYRHIRHPAYTAVLLILAGLPLIFQNWYGFLWLCVVCGGFLVIRIPHEEEMLIRAFGERYREYMKHTKRLIPFLY